MSPSAFNRPVRHADNRLVRPSRIARLLIALAFAALTACSFPAEPRPVPEPNPEIEDYLEELNRDAERRMEEMMRENEELFDQFGTEDDSLTLTGIGG